MFMLLTIFNVQTSTLKFSFHYAYVIEFFCSLCLKWHTWYTPYLYSSINDANFRWDGVHYDQSSVSGVWISLVYLVVTSAAAYIITNGLYSSCTVQLPRSSTGVLDQQRAGHWNGEARRVYTMSQKTSRMLSAIICEVLTDFYNSFTARKLINFANKQVTFSITP